VGAVSYNHTVLEAGFKISTQALSNTCKRFENDLHLVDKKSYKSYQTDFTAAFDVSRKCLIE
jgi:hypothetical protein